MCIQCLLSISLLGMYLCALCNMFMCSHMYLHKHDASARMHSGEWSVLLPSLVQIVGVQVAETGLVGGP